MAYTISKFTERTWTTAGLGCDCANDEEETFHSYTAMWLSRLLYYALQRIPGEQKLQQASIC